MADSVLFEDIFTISVVDPDGKKFDRVSRLVAHSEQFDMDLLLDVNIDVYPIARSEKKFTLALAATLNLDGTQDDGTFDQTRRKSLADKYEYVMYGKVYKCADASAAATAAGGGRRGSGATAKVEVYISFGGLLMCLKGEPNNLSNLLLDQRVYLLMRKMDFYYHSCGNADSGLLSASAAGMQMEVYFHPYLWESRWRSISILTAAGILRDKEVTGLEVVLEIRGGWLGACFEILGAWGLNPFCIHITQWGNVEVITPKSNDSIEQLFTLKSRCGSHHYRIQGVAEAQLLYTKACKYHSYLTFAGKPRITKKIHKASV